MFWVYKCNARGHEHQRAVGDWDEFFESHWSQRWGSTQYVPDVLRPQPGHVVLCYQTDRNELVGLARVVGHERRGRHQHIVLKPLRTIRAKVRPLKLAHPAVAAIPALRPGPIRTIYDISATDARRLLAAAGVHAPSDGGATSASTHVATRGGGFGSAEENKLVEAAAVRFVSRALRSEGWTVRDVSDQPLGYDLSCEKDRQIAHVEVKGASGSELQFILTENERATWASDSAFALALVTNATKGPTLHRFNGKRALRRFILKPLSYMVRAKDTPA